MEDIDEPVPDSRIVHSLNEAKEFAHEVGLPLIVRPAYTLGGVLVEEQLILPSNLKKLPCMA